MQLFPVNCYFGNSYIVTKLNKWNKKSDLDYVYGIGFKDNINLPNYTHVQCETESNKGGTLMYISNRLNFEHRLDLQIYKAKELESNFIEVNNPKGKNYLVGCIYRHPSMNQIDFLQNYFVGLLEKINNENKQIILMGDFNFDLLNHEKDPHTETFLDMITSSSLMPLILKPTRITSHSKTLIDNVFTNILDKKVTAGNLITTIADHLPQFAIFEEKCKFYKSVPKFKHNFKKFTQEKFILDVLEVDWDKEIDVQKNGVNKFTEKLTHILNKIILKHAPLTKISKNKTNKNKPWISKGIITSMNRRDNLHRKYINEKNEIKKQEYFTLYKQYRNMILTLCRLSKITYFQTFFTENKNNIKATWQGIKTFIDSKGKSNNIPHIVTINDQNENDPEKIADAFNDYFGNIAETTKKKIVKTDKSFSDYLTDNNQNSFFFSPTNNEEVHKIITSLDATKSTGPMSVQTNLLKLISPTVSVHLAKIINHSFLTGIFPECIQTANITPVHKKGPTKIIENYRPISLLSNIGKIVEKIVHTRLYSFLIKSKSFYKFQFGFRTQHSTNHALMLITEKIRNALDEGGLACGVFVDLQKAFDTVEHSILLSKLSHYGVRGLPNDWFKSYLSNRKQFVTVHGKKSRLTNSKHGVPQGSILGPLLFLIYINDLHKSIAHSQVFHFADDTSLIIEGKSLKTLNRSVNRDLKLLSEWLRSNKISLNASKTELILFHPKHKLIKKNLNFRLSGQKLHPKKETEYLGVLLDENLSFEPYLRKL